LPPTLKKTNERKTGTSKKRKYRRMDYTLFLGIGTQEIIVIALIVLLLFGGSKIPELMKGLGKGVKSFKEGMNEINEINDTKELDSKPSKEDKPEAQ